MGPVSWVTQATGEGQKSFCTAVRPWGVQSAGNRQDLQAPKPLEQTLLRCFLSLHRGSSLRGRANEKPFFWNRASGNPATCFPRRNIQEMRSQCGWVLPFAFLTASEGHISLGPAARKVASNPRYGFWGDVFLLQGGTALTMLSGAAGFGQLLQKH